MTIVKISLVDIFKYVGDRNRPMVEGEQVFKAGHVILCQIKSIERLEIFGLVLQTSSLTSKPHEVNLCLNNTVNNWMCVCSCKAGKSGFCKHVVAMLIYINRHEQLEEFSCTSSTQAWGKEKENIKTIYEAEPITNFHHQRKPNIDGNVVFSYSTDEALEKRNFERFVNCNKLSALHMFVERSRNSIIREEDITTEKRKLNTLGSHAAIKVILENAACSVLENMELPEFPLEECCVCILENLRSDDVLDAAVIDQAMAGWQSLRKLRITGSRIYSIFTYAKDDWSEKAVGYFWPKSFTSKFTDYGKKYEAYALKAYKKKYPYYHVENMGICISRRYPWFAYSPDGVIFKNGNPIKLLEIKCPYAGKHHDIKQILEGCTYLERKEDTWFLKRKHIYYGQVQFGMGLLNLKSTDLIIYSTATDSFININVELDVTFTRNMILKVNEMYMTNMIHHYCTNKVRFEK